MKIISGLFNHIVLQRNAKGCSDALVVGEASRPGSVRVTVRRGGRVAPGFADRRVGRSRAGRFSARLTGLPVGGPYHVECFLESAGRRERVVIRDVLVGDVWLLGGQSNMEGVGLLADALPPRPLVRCCYANDEWAVAKDPLHGDGPSGQAPVNKVGGTGPGMAFGQEMLRRTEVPQGLIACARGGTSMGEWDPALLERGAASLYGNMIRRLKKCGGRVAGMIWYQGEADANPDTAPLYTRRMQTLVRALRRDAGDRSLPVVIAQLARFVLPEPVEHPWWNNIQEQQRLLPRHIARLLTVPTIDLTLDDLIHLSGRDQARLGRRMAEAMDVLQRGVRAGPPPIELASVRKSVDPQTGVCRIRLSYRHVLGRLCSGARPMGFSVRGATGAELLVDTRLEGATVVLVTTFRIGEQSQGVRVAYGVGANPPCTVTDEGDRSLPVIEGLSVKDDQIYTPYARDWRMTYHDGEVSALRQPPVGPARWQKDVVSGEDLANNHPDFEKERTGLLLLETAFSCAEPMRLKALLGYDGPVRLWLDGRLLFTDLAGTNPARKDESATPAFPCPPGNHLVSIALGANGGRAWGVFLRLKRLGPGSAPAVPKWMKV